MAEWLVELKGDRSDLEYLCALPSQRWKVTEQGGRHYLKSTVFDSPTDARDVLADASRTLDVMNGVARLVFPNFEGAKVNSIARVEENGRCTQFIMPTGTRSAERSGIPTVVISGGHEPPEPPSIPGSKWIEIAQKDESVATALALYGGLEHNWRNLYVVLEVIEDALGGNRLLINKGWAPQGEIERFKHTANSFRALGRQARHGITKWDPPRSPMSFNDAQSLIRNILYKWLCSKCQ